MNKRLQELFIAVCFSVSATFSAELTVIYSAETHAMLEPCESCYNESGGGLALRGGFLNGVVAERSQDLLLLDGGGFSGGGIYDTYSIGRAADSVRTIKTITAMGLMHYDAVAIGDDDLQYGGEWLLEQAKRARLPLVCANCFTADGKYFTAPYIIVKKGMNTFGVTSVVTSERLFPIDTAVIIKDPVAGLERIRREMRRKSDYQILLSHLGEEETGALLKRVSGYLLAGNSHRKMSVQPLITLSRVPTLNFGFQGKSLAYAILNWRNRGLRVKHGGWFGIGGDFDTGVDESVAAVTAVSEAGAIGNTLAATERGKIYDLYIRSMCPDGIPALSDVAELIRAFPDKEWNVWFIGTIENDKLSSLRGDVEMFDETLWLGVKALYPFRYHEFLFLKASSVAASTEDLLEEMGLDVVKIRQYAQDMGQSELRQHYLRSMRLDVNASPTLFINNNLYNRPIGGGRLVRNECHAANMEPPFCSDYPVCFEDGDCRAVGKIGKCVKDEAEGRVACEFTDDATFALTVLVADSAMDNPEKGAIELIKEMLPGAMVNIVKISSDDGRRVMAKHTPDALPFFVFDKNVSNADRFSSIAETVGVLSDGNFAFKRGAVKENFFPKREANGGLVELYLDPIMPSVGKIIDIVLTEPAFAKRVVLRPALERDPRGQDLSASDRQRSEEALRWLVMAKEFPKKYKQYLKLYGGNPGSTYWFNWLREIGMNKNKFLRRLEANKSKIAPYWESFSAVSSGESVMILINNRVKVSVSNEKELVRVLKSIY